MLTRDDRSVRLLGAEGQARLRRASIAIGGVGGLGAHVAIQLAFHGAKRIVLIDHDLLGETSMNRWVLGCWQDIGRPKVDVARERLLAIQPTLDVVTVEAKVDAALDLRPVLECDYVIGCFDNDLARLQMTRACSAAARPYFDLATDVDASDPPRYGGRILFSHEGRGCLVCMKLIDPVQLGDEPGASADRAATYGVPRDALDPNAGPAIVSTNGVVASLAVDALVALAAGLRVPPRLLVYRADRGTVTRSRDEPASDCYYCAALYGTSRVHGT